MKRIAFLVLFLCVCGIVRADEQIVDFSDKSLPVLNEELRQLRGRIGGGSSATQTRVILWYVGGDLEVGDTKGATVYVPFAGTLTKALANVTTAPTGDDIDITIMKNGADVLSGSLTIAATESYGETSSFSDISVASGDYITVNVDTIGSSVAGANLTVELYVSEA